MRNNKGLTILEIVIILVIAGVAIPVLLASFANIVGMSADAKAVTVATDLAQEKMEEIIKGKRFSEIVSQGPIDFTGSFSTYNYEIPVDYVSADNLDQPIEVGEPPTDFKLVQVKITKDGDDDFNVTLMTIITNLGY